MQNLFENNFKNNQEVLDVFNQAAKVGLEYSVSLWKTQSEYLTGKINRNLSAAPQFSNLTDAEKAVGFQKELGEEELTALQKNGETVLQLTESAGDELVKLGKKGQAILSKRFDEAVELTAAGLPNGNGKLVTDALQDANKTAWQLIDNGFDWAYQSTRAGVDSIIQRHNEVKEAVAGAAASAASANADGTEKPRGKKRS